MGLKFKIFIGYVILIFLLGFIIYLFREEQIKRNVLNREMKELEMAHELARNVYSTLLELASQSEVVSVWHETDLKQYREKREEVCDVLKKLRSFVHASNQKIRIDSVCLMLEQKEMLLLAIMNTFDELGNIAKTVEKKIPAIVRQVRRQPLNAISVVPALEDSEGIKELAKEKTKKISFLKSLFGRKERKSAYKQWREKKEAEEKKNTSSGVVNRSNTATVQLLHSLNDEVNDKIGYCKNIKSWDFLLELKKLKILWIPVSSYNERPPQTIINILIKNGVKGIN